MAPGITTNPTGASSGHKSFNGAEPQHEETALQAICHGPIKLPGNSPILSHLVKPSSLIDGILWASSPRLTLANFYTQGFPHSQILPPTAIGL